MFGRIQNTKKIDNFYENICIDIDSWLDEHKLFEYQDLLVTPSKHPVIGIHSTTYKSLDDILEYGFDSEKGIQYGEIDNRPLALFSPPYFEGDKVKISGKRRHDYIVYTNGFNRVIKDKLFKKFNKHGISMEELKKNYPSGFLGFPIIISAFQKVSDNDFHIDRWISSWNPKKHCIILGIIHVYFTFEEIIEKYNLFKIDKLDTIVLDHDLKYEIEWFDGFIKNYIVVGYDKFS